MLLNSAWGDHEAFTRLYHATAPYLLALATRILNSRDQGEEVLQEAIVQAWYYAKDYDPTKGTALAWLAGIVRHRALDRRRYEQRHRARRQACGPTARLHASARSSGVRRNTAANCRRCFTACGRSQSRSARASCWCIIMGTATMRWRNGYNSRSVRSRAGYDAA